MVYKSLSKAIESYLDLDRFNEQLDQEEIDKEVIRKAAEGLNWREPKGEMNKDEGEGPWSEGKRVGPSPRQERERHERPILDDKAW